MPVEAYAASYALAVITWAVPDDAFESAPPQDADRDAIELVETIKTTGPVASLDFTPDGSQFVSGGTDGGSGLVSTFPDGDIVHRLTADSRASHVAVSPDGKRIVEAHGTVLTFWDRERGERLRDAKLTSTVQVQNQDVNLVYGIRSAAWSPDGGTLVIACSRPVYGQGDQQRTLQTGYAFLVRLDGETAKIGRRFQHRGDVQTACFLGDGSRIVTACEDGGVRIWSADTGKLLHEHNARGGPVASLDATTDGGYVVAGLEDGSVRVWETRYGRPVLRLDGHRGAVTAVRFLPDETRLVTGDAGGTLHLWDLSEARQLARAATGAETATITPHPDGEHVLTAGSKSPDVKLWRLPAAPAAAD